MIKPRVDKLLEHTDTHYAAVLVAAKRARQINAYYHSLSEGAYGEYTPPMVEVPSGNYLTIAWRRRRPASSSTSTRPSRRRGPMARILLGVSGGIAAYKSLELARLATKEGHAVRVLMTPAAKRFVGQASFEGIVGAPVLTDEFERDPNRGAFPGDPVRSMTRSGTSRSSPTQTCTWWRRHPPTRSRSSPPGSRTRWSRPRFSPAPRRDWSLRR
jgi:DNA-directed RNA polymerase omega subunit